MHLTTYLDLLQTGEQTLADSYRQVAKGHAAEADVQYTCLQFAANCDAHVEALSTVQPRYDGRREAEPDRLHPAGLTATRTGPVGLLRDLQDLYQLATLIECTWTMVGQAAHGARDRELIDVATRAESETTAQLAWLRTRMRAAAPQTLLVAP